MPEYILAVPKESILDVGTYDHVYATLIGDVGESKRTELNVLKILPGKRTFTIESKESLGNILLLKLEKEKWSFLPEKQWFCSKIVVTTPDKEIIFPCYRWLSNGEEVELRGGKAIKVNQETHPRLADHRKNELEKRKKTFIWDPAPKITAICKMSNFDDVSKIPDRMKFSWTRFLLPPNVKAGILTALTLRQSDWKDFEEMKQMCTSPMQKYVAEHWREDEFFGYQFLNGINPNVIKRCSKLPRNFPVTEEMVKPFLQEGSSLEQEMENGNIFLYDQKILDGLKVKMTAALCLFYLNPQNKLMPIAIQLFQEPSPQNPIFLPNDLKTDWLLAKIFVKNGDLLLHEAVYHLLATHLLEESFAVATLRNFPAIHPLYKLLMPHFRYTMHINTLARTQLLGPQGIFSESTIKLNGTTELMEKGFSEMTYSSLCLPDNITARGLDSVPNFYYRDDGLKLWNITKRFVEKVVKHYYSSDQDVVDDTELQNWIKEVFAHCFLKKEGFPERFADVDEVVKFITMVIFTSTGQHAAVNNGQADFALYVANAPLLVRKPPPTTKGQSSEDTVLKTLPNKSQTAKFGILATVLSDQYGDRVLVGKRTKELFQEQVVKNFMEEFQEDLSKLHAEIADRNAMLELPYTYLDPDQIESSVAI